MKDNTELHFTYARYVVSAHAGADRHQHTEADRDSHSYGDGHAHSYLD